MKFDYVIGNPPYQESKGGTKNIDVWPYYVVSATGVAKNVLLIHPGRWIIPKKQMKSIHDIIINSGLKSFNYYPNATKVFKNVLIDGGVTITCFKKAYNDTIRYFNEGKYFGIYDEHSFISDKFEAEIIQNIDLNKYENISKRILGNIGSLGGSEFGYSKVKHLALLKDSSKGMLDPIKVWANRGYGKGTRFSWYFIEKNRLNIPTKLLATRKVMIDKKGHSINSGRGNIINNIPIIVDKNVIASGDVLFVFPENDNDYELQLIKSMFMTKTVRFLMSITQKDLYVRGFENVPDYTYFIPLLKNKIFTDEFFYKTFNFSNELITHIEKYVSPKVETHVKEMA